ncbi:MAG TPA: DAK2 domain-containing protein [Anaerolineaceae bacterium]
MSSNQQLTTSPTEGRPTPSMERFDGQNFKELVEAALTWLKTNQQTVNALNVFPVPDGDTGTNMLLTMQSAYNEIANSGEKNVGKIVHAVAQGALMGARGNSGVILSQIWRGIARASDNHDHMDVKMLAQALTEGRNTAYKGVVRPVEGTILTVVKDVAAAAEEAAGNSTDLVGMLEKIVAAADASVQHTPELLPVLKQAGVVDSGGKGLYFILEGMLRHLKGMPLETPTATVQPLSAMQMEQGMEEIEPGQDYEVVVDFRPNGTLDLDHFYKGLGEIGTSIQVGEGDGFYRMHIHVPTEKRYEPIEFTMKLGTITKIAMENLLAQMETLSQNAEARLPLTTVEPGQIAVVAVSPGQGISRIFASLGVAAIVQGGQTMNPSTEEIVRAFEDLPTDKIIILPNNKNIVLAAQTASTVSVKKVAVIPCTSVPQGLSAMLRMAPEGDFDRVVREMTESAKDVITGEITIATRSVEINGVKVEAGEVIGLLNGKLVTSERNLEDACLDLLKKGETDDRERITLFYGDNISRHEVNQIVDKIRAAYPSHEIELHEGMQPHYQFIISVE